MADETPSTSPARLSFGGKQQSAGLSKGSTVVRNPDVIRIQALAMMRELAGGKSLADVALKFNVSNHIVKARLNYAQRAGLFVHHKDVILRGMVPLAEDVLIEELVKGNVNVALEVYKGTGLFRKPGTRAPAATENDGKGQGETLESHIAKLRTAQELFETTGVVDVEFTNVFGLLTEGVGVPAEPAIEADIMASGPSESSEASSEALALVQLSLFPPEPQELSHAL